VHRVGFIYKNIQGRAVNRTLKNCEYEALHIRHAKLMHRILSSVACQAVPEFSPLSKKTARFSEKIIECKMRVLIFSTMFAEIFFSF
jgi:hypothetical protein